MVLIFLRFLYWFRIKLKFLKYLFSFFISFFGVSCFVMEVKFLKLEKSIVVFLYCLVWVLFFIFSFFVIGAGRILSSNLLECWCFFLISRFFVFRFLVVWCLVVK